MKITLVYLEHQFLMHLRLQLKNNPTALRLKVAGAKRAVVHEHTVEYIHAGHWFYS